MRESAPSVTTIMKGKPSQTLVATFAEKAVQKRENHEIGLHARRAASRPLMAPNCRWNMPFQMSAVM